MDEVTLKALGPRLRHLRLRRDISLTRLAEATGISTSTLSRLETGLRRPSLEQLLPLARFHGMTMDTLVDAPPTADPRADLRPVEDGEGGMVIPLTRRPGGIQAHKFVRPANAEDAEPELRTHEGYVWIYVLDGTLRLVVGHAELLLTAGEAVEFDSRVPHWLGATSAGPVEYLDLIGRQGQRTRLRAAPHRR